MQFDNRMPVDTERQPVPVPVTGRIPAGLAGTLFRNGPNPCRPDPAAHWFVGDGMVHAFTIGSGGVTYANRWIRTKAWAQANGCAETGLSGSVANTNVVSHAGRLMALEERHLPVVFDPATLATVGEEDFAGSLPPGPFTAHPKRDPATGALVCFGYGVGGLVSPTLWTGEISSAGLPERLRTAEAPYAAMVHDFAVTGRRIAIPLFPLVFDGEGGFRWEPERGAFLGVMDRKRSTDGLRWFRAGPGFAFHVMNAWDEDDTLCIDLMLSDAPPFFPGPAGVPAASPPAHLRRWSITLADASPAVVSRSLSATPGEFPRIDERVAGCRNRHGYFRISEGLCHRDDLTGEERFYRLPPGDTVSEPVFAPRGPDEGDGWLLAVVFRQEHGGSELVVLDATDLTAGPVAVAYLPNRVPAGFHGAWVGDRS